jgi:peptidoglycan/xylan/chitin deacetylase (PgdA/CDA1 family)
LKAVLTYHSIDSSGSAVSVSEDDFREHVRWFASGAVSVVPLPELLQVPQGQDAMAITFDDGLESFGRIAAPMLLESDIPATVFVVAGRVGQDSAWPSSARGPSVPVFPLLDWDALAGLAERGIEMGAHTLTHPHLTSVGPEEASEEILGGVELVAQNTGARPRSFAYPYGSYDDAVVEMAEATFDISVTTELGVLPSEGCDPHRIPRLDMVYFRSPATLRSWGRRRFGAYLGLRRAIRNTRTRVTALWS